LKCPQSIDIKGFVGDMVMDTRGQVEILKDEESDAKVMPKMAVFGKVDVRY
jgi:hypothetical protein